MPFRIFLNYKSPWRRRKKKEEEEEKTVEEKEKQLGKIL